MHLVGQDGSHHSVGGGREVKHLERHVKGDPPYAGTQRANSIEIAEPLNAV